MDIFMISGIIIQILKLGCTKKPALWRRSDRPSSIQSVLQCKDHRISQIQVLSCKQI